MSGSSLAQIVFSSLVAIGLILGIFLWGYHLAFGDGYQQGYSQAKAGLCQSDYISCDHPENKKK